LNTLLLIDSLGSGGAQRQIIYHAIALKKLGHNPVIVYYHNKNIYHQQLYVYNLNYEYIPKNRSNYIKFIHLLFKYIKKNNIKLITTYLFIPNLIGLFIKIFKRNNIFLIISERTFELNISILNKLTRNLYNFADIITCNSFHQFNFLKTKLPSLKNKIHYLPNIIDFANFINTNSNELFKNNINQIIAVGRVQQNKNPLILIRAIGFLQKSNNIHYNVKWYGSIIDIPYFKLCCNEIEKFDLSNNWEWMGESNNIHNKYLESSIFYHGSFGEGFPNVICEALAIQRIVIASNVYDHPLIIKNKKNGFLFNPNDLDELIHILIYIQRLSTSDILLIQKEAQLSVINNFSITNHINSLIKFSIAEA